MKYYSLEALIKGFENHYCETDSREFGAKSVRRGAWEFEDTTVGDFVVEVIIADLIIKNENCTWECYIPRIEAAVNAVLSRSPKIDDLEEDEWPLMLEIAERVKDGLPNIKILPDGEDLLDGRIKDLENCHLSRTASFGCNSARRAVWVFEDIPVGKYVDEVILTDIIIKNENRIWRRYIPRVEAAVNAVLSHSPKINELEQDEWPLMLEIAQRVKDNLPDIVVVPDGKD